jgi:hypothetical protein
VFEVVVVVGERLLRVERWIDVTKPDFADIFWSEVRNAVERLQCVECVASNQQIVAGPSLGNLPRGTYLVEESYLGDTIVRGRQPLVGAILVS